MINLRVQRFLKRAKRFISNPEAQILADLFLAPYKFDRKNEGYKCFKTAMLIAAHGYVFTTEIYDLGAACLDMDTDTFVLLAANAVKSLKEPIADTFNRTFFLDEPNRVFLRMRSGISMCDDLHFLGVCFYLNAHKNYPEIYYGYP